MRIVFAGTPEVAVPSLAALLASRHEVVAVVTRPDAPSGRGKRLTASPVAEQAAGHGLEVLKPPRPRDEDFLARLREIAPDCCPVVAYGALLPAAALDIPAHGWVNLHFSVLPRWRGAAPVQHAVLAGDPETGATTFEIVAALDAGPVYADLTEPIGATDTAGDLLDRLARRGAALLVDTLDAIEAGARPHPQPADGVTVAPKIAVEDARIGWDQPAEVIDRLIRGCAPAPGAWTTFRGERFKIVSAALEAESADGTTDPEPPAPGVLRVSKRSVQVGTGTRPLTLGTVQPPGKKAMAAPDWARGTAFDPAAALGT